MRWFLFTELTSLELKVLLNFLLAWISSEHVCAYLKVGSYTRLDLYNLLGSDVNPFYVYCVRARVD